MLSFHIVPLLSKKIIIITIPLWHHPLIFDSKSIFPDSRKLDDPCAYPNACPSYLKDRAANSSWGVKSKQLETVPPANISAHVGRRIQSTTKESSMSTIVTLSLLLQSRRWSQRWTSWRRHVSSTTKLEDITMLRMTPSNSINNV